MSKKKFRGEILGGSTKGRAMRGMVRKKNFKKKKFRGDFLGGSYTGGRVWGECWEIKEKIGAKKISGGQKFWGELLGEMQKKRGKTFLGGVLGEL